VTFEDEAAQAIISIATSALGVIGTIVGAFFGIRVGAGQTEKLVDQNRDLVNANAATEAKANVYALYASHPNPPSPSAIHQEALQAWLEVRGASHAPSTAAR
jgi:hypothetical protein